LTLGNEKHRLLPLPGCQHAHLHYPGGTFVRQDFTARGQLAATGWDDDENNWWMKLAAYTYLTDGKVGEIDLGNGVRTGYGFDQRGFIQIVEHHRPGVQDLSWRYYWRDERDRITAFQKGWDSSLKPMENGHGDRFRYDAEGQLLEAWYGASDPANSGAGNWRYDGFNYDELGNRAGGNFLANHGAMTFTRKDNGLNQYSGWWNFSGTNYDDDIGPPWGTPGYANGVLMQDGNVTASTNCPSSSIQHRPARGVE
jgi:hypothetical protein